MPNLEINFEWDASKAQANLRKHVISFERAATVFRDSDAMTLYDREHSEGEDRWITLGLDMHGILVVICHMWSAREDGYVRCRIISARKATKHEAKQYQRKAP